MPPSQNSSSFGQNGSDKLTDKEGELAKLNTPPHSIEAEQAVLGSVMQSVDAWDKVAEILIEEDFYNRSHRIIFAFISKLIAKNSEADPVTLKDELDASNKLDEVGGYNYIVTLARNIPSSSNVVAYANIVRERAIVRELIGAANDIADLSFNPEGRDSKELLDIAETKVFEIAEKRTTANEGPIGVTGALRKTIQRIELLAEQDREVTGVSTGFTDLDKKTSGLQPSDLIIVAARPSMGKCLAAGTMMVEPFTGKMVSIEEKYKQRSTYVTSLQNDFSLTTSQASEFVDDGVKPVFRVTTHLGKTVTSTLSHPFLTTKGWVPLREIDVGEYIAVPKCLPIFGSQSEKYDELVHFASEICLNNDTFSYRLKNTVSMQLKGNTSDAEEHSDEVGLENALGASLPNHLFCLKKPLLEVFLNLTFSNNATLTRHTLNCEYNQNKDTVYTLRYIAINKSVAENIQHLLLRFGYLVQLQELNSEFVLDFIDTKDILDFLVNIGMTHTYDLSDVVFELCEQAHGNKERIPETVTQYIYKLRGDRTWQQLCDKKGVSACATGIEVLLNSSTHLNREDIGFFAFLLDDNYLQNLSQSDIYWDQITSIEYLGEQQVYDLSVPSLHNFIAQDICVHNTTFAMNLVENALMLEDKPVLVFSLEMPSEQIMMRMLASLSRVDQTSIRTARLEDTDWAKIQSSVKMLKEKDNLFIDDSSGLTPMEVRTRARKLARERGGISLIMVDYLQLMRVPSLSDNRTLEIAEISRSLKALAKELSCPVVALSQLNRGLEQRADKRPINSDLRESGAIEQDADLIMFIYRDEVYNENSDLQGVAEIIIGKQRNGPIGTTRLTFQGQFSRFDNYAGPVYDD